MNDERSASRPRYLDQGEMMLRPFLREGEVFICNAKLPIYQEGPPFIIVFEVMAAFEDHYTDIHQVFSAYDKDGVRLVDQVSIVGKPKLPSQ